MYSVDEATNEVVNKLKAIDMDLETNYSDEFGRAKLEPNVFLSCLCRQKYRQ
jgi:hypothetical protein